MTLIAFVSGVLLGGLLIAIFAVGGMADDRARRDAVERRYRELEGVE
jgi:hypothetical protein